MNLGLTFLRRPPGLLGLPEALIDPLPVDQRDGLVLGEQLLHGWGTSFQWNQRLHSVLLPLLLLHW